MDFIDSLTGSPNTLKTYRSLFRRWIEPYLTPDEARESNRFVVQKVMNNWSHLSSNTQTALLNLLKQYIEFHYGSISTKGPRKTIAQPKPRPKALTKKQAKKLLTYCEQNEPDLYPLVLCALHTGMRRGEILGLQVQDVDLDRGVIMIQRSDTGPTKNRQSRTLRMSKVLRDHFHKRNYLCKPPDALVFKRVDLFRYLRRVFRKLGLPEHYNMHSLRHTFATRALDSGKSIKQVQDALGHTNPTTTINIYWSNIKGDLDPDDFI